MPFTGVRTTNTRRRKPSAWKEGSMDVAAAVRAAFVAEIASAHSERLAASSRQGFLVGLIGRGIEGSRSPRMHEREGERLGQLCSYALLDFDRFGVSDHELGVVVDEAEENGFSGLNVTHPFKQSVIEHLT